MRRIEIGTAADPQTAAAVIAAVEQFTAEITAVAAPVESPDPWQRAALLEGVGGKRIFGSADPGGSMWR